MWDANGEVVTCATCGAAYTPGGEDVVLEKAHHLLAGEDGLLALAIDEVKRGAIAEDLVHATVAHFVPQAADNIPQIKEFGQNLNRIYLGNALKGWLKLILQGS